MSRFFITGIPRSRTVWCANLFTYGNSFCFHDALKNGGSAAGVIQQMDDVESRNPFLRNVGDSDSGLVFFAGDLAAQMPEARWLFISNTKDRAEASYRKHFAEHDPYHCVNPGAMFDACIEKYELAKSQIPDNRKREISVVDLDDLGNVASVWEWLVPGNPWFEDRARMLDTFQLNPFAKKTIVSI